jgi:hypothetical protein
VTKVEMTFYSSGGWELDDLGRVANNGGADSILRFRLERGGDGVKRCQKMKRMQRACLGSMRRKKRDMVWWRGDIGRRTGGTGEGGTRQRHLD